MRTFAIAVLLSTVAFAVSAQTGPQLSATARQMRVEAESVGPVRLWDTTWWIEVQVAATSADLARIDYRARFTDGASSAAQSGGWDLSPTQSRTANVRIPVRCAVRRDYDRKLRVSLRVQDTGGTASDWVEINFPGDATVSRQTSVRPPAEGASQGTRRTESLGTVEFEGSESMTMAEMREGLERRARDKGGDAVTNAQIVDSDPQHLVMRADVLRYVDVPAAPTIATPAQAASDSVLGEIDMAESRRGF